MTAGILFEQQKHIGVIRLARPQALNAINLPMVKAMQQQLSAWQVDDSIHAVVLEAEPGKAFCAGGDVRWLYETGLARDPEQMQFFWHEYRLNHFIHQFGKPYIALMDGITMGGGVGISLHGSSPVASERFVFAMPETGLGLFPDIGASYLLSRCPGRVGVYLGLTGNRLTAQDARVAGLLRHVIPAERFSRIVPGLQALDLSQQAQQQVDALLTGLSVVEEAALTAELPDINRYFAAHTVADIMASLQQGGSDWAATMAASLRQKSPTSLAVTLAQIERAASLNLAECLQMDYGLVKHFMADKDFYEGVRALLIDKDKNPHWQPLKDDTLMTYFERDSQGLVL